MQPASLIPDYLDKLARELAFDTALAERVRAEVEDHLREAVAAGPDGQPREAERLAIARFGSPHKIAAEFAATALVKESKTVGLMVMLVIAGVYVTMRSRILWWGASSELQQLAGRAFAVAFTRYTFWLSLLVGFAAWIFAARGRILGGFDAGSRKHLQRAFLLSAGATAVTLAAVATDVFLVALRLSSTGWSDAALVPVLLLGIEIALSAVLTTHLQGVMRRAWSSPALLGD